MYSICTALYKSIFTAKKAAILVDVADTISLLLLFLFSLPIKALRATGVDDQ